MVQHSQVSGYLYRSSAVLPQDADGGIYLPARIKNRRLGVSGFLHRQEGTYVQYLEGDHRSVEGLSAVIAKDARHTDFEELFSGRAPTRLSGSTMGYTTEDDMDWRDWAKSRDLIPDIDLARPAELIAFMTSYGDAVFAAANAELWEWAIP